MKILHFDDNSEGKTNFRTITTQSQDFNIIYDNNLPVIPQFIISEMTSEFIEIPNFEDTKYQTLVRDNPLEEKRPVILPLSKAIAILKKNIKRIKEEEEIRLKKELDEIEEASESGLDEDI